MTRAECERLVLDKMAEIREIYREYNPDEKNGLTMFFRFSEDGNMNRDGAWDCVNFFANNCYWEGGEDHDRPLNVHGCIDLPGKKWDACEHEEGDVPGVPSWRKYLIW